MRMGLFSPAMRAARERAKEKKEVTTTPQTEPQTTKIEQEYTKSSEISQNPESFGYTRKGNVLTKDITNTKTGDYVSRETISLQNNEPVSYSRKEYKRGYVKRRTNYDFREGLSTSRRENYAQSLRQERDAKQSQQFYNKTTGEYFKATTPKTYFIPQKKEVPTAFKKYDTQIEYLSSGGVRVYRDGKQIKLTDAGFTEAQKKAIAARQKFVSIDQQRRRATLAKSRAAASESFYIRYGRSLGITGDNTAQSSMTDPITRADTRARAQYVKAVIGEQNKRQDFLDNLMPRDNRRSAYTGTLIDNGDTYATTGIFFGSDISYSSDISYFQARYQEQRQKEKERAEKIIRNRAQAKDYMDKNFPSPKLQPWEINAQQQAQKFSQNYPITSATLGAVYDTGYKFTIGFTGEYASGAVKASGAFVESKYREALIRSKNFRAFRGRFTEQERSFINQPTIKAISQRDTQVFYTATGAAILIASSPYVATAVLTASAGSGFYQSYKDFSKGNVRGGVSNFLEGATFGYFAGKSGQRIPVPKWAENLYSKIDYRYKPVETDSLGRRYIDLGGRVKVGETFVNPYTRTRIVDLNKQKLPKNWIIKTDTLAATKQRVSGYTRGIYEPQKLILVPEGKPQYIARTLTKEQQEYLKNNPMEQAFRGGYGYDFREQGSFAGTIGGASGQRGFFTLFKRERLAFKPQDKGIEQSFFLTPRNTETGNYYVRPSRILTRDVSVSDMLKGDFTLTPQSPKPQVLLFEKDKISTIPKELRGLYERGARGDLRAQAQFFKKYEPYQLAEGTGKFKPFGFASSELEATTIKDTIGSTGVKAVTFIEGKRVVVYGAEIRKGKSTITQSSEITRQQLKTSPSTLSSRRPKELSYSDFASRTVSPFLVASTRTGKISGNKLYFSASLSPQETARLSSQISQRYNNVRFFSTVSSSSEPRGSSFVASSSTPIAYSSPASSTLSTGTSQRAPTYTQYSTRSPISRITTTRRSTTSDILRPPSTAYRDSTKKESLAGRFDVLVRRSGRFERIGTTKTLKSAFDIGERKVRQTAAASFKVLSRGGQSVTPSLLPRGFYKSERELGVVIQKPSYRISSQGEKFDITYKGIRSQKKKKRRRFFI